MLICVNRLILTPEGNYYTPCSALQRSYLTNSGPLGGVNSGYTSQKYTGGPEFPISFQDFLDADQAGESALSKRQLISEVASYLEDY